MDQIEPLISASVAGPLGVLHLPRLWLKILLHAYGRLPEGYRHGSGGFDELFCTSFGIDCDAFVTFIETEKPDYQRTEQWVVANAKDLTPHNIAAFNQRILTGNMREETAAERRAQFNIADTSFANAVALNNLDDWAGFHKRLTRQE
jgi:Domain of unknown function (DUF5069)